MAWVMLQGSWRYDVRAPCELNYCIAGQIALLSAGIWVRGESPSVFVPYFTFSSSESFLLQICRCILDRGHDVTINTGAPLEFFTSQLPHARLHTRKALLDSGAYQQDAFTVDMRSKQTPLSVTSVISF